MSQHLSSIAGPFAVLGVGGFVGFDFTGCDKGNEFLLASDDAHCIVLAESKLRHHIEDILQQYLRGIHLLYLEA